MTDLYKKNIAALQHLKEPDQQPFSNKNQRETELIKVKNSDLLTIRVNGILLNSSFDPVREAKNSIKDIDFSQYETIVSAGFGSGYLCEEIYNNLGKEQKLIIIILNPDIFEYILNYRGFNKLFTDERVRVIYAEDEKQLLGKTVEIMQETDESKTKLIIHKPSLSITTFPAIKDVLNTIDIQATSSQHFKKVNITNVENNKDLIISSPGVNLLTNIFEGKTAVIVSPGPSLQSDIEILKNARNLLIIATGTAVPVLLKHNIKPHFICIQHGEDNVYHNQLKDISDSNLPLIFLPGSNHIALKNYPGKIVAALPDRDYYFQLDKLLDKGLLRSCGSVATLAIDLAKLMGIKHIILTGQDLSVSEKGDIYSGKDEKIIETGNLKKIITNSGKTGYTPQKFYLFLRWIEEYIALNNNIRFSNTSKEGAEIKGAVYKPLAELVKQTEKTEPDKNLIHTALLRYKLPDEAIIKQAEKIIDNITST